MIFFAVKLPTTGKNIHSNLEGMLKLEGGIFGWVLRFQIQVTVRCHDVIDDIMTQIRLHVTLKSCVQSISRGGVCCVS